MNAAKKIILLLWLVLVASRGNVSALTPGPAQTCAWEKSLATLATRQAEPLQTAGRHQEKGRAAYDFASASLLAAEGGGTGLLAPYTGYQSWAGDIRSVTAASDTTMYRVWGGGSPQAGAWLSPVAPTSAAAATDSLALPAANTAQFYSEVLVPAGTRYQIGTAAAANGLGGGGVQVQLLERIPLGNYGPGIPLR